MIPPLPVGGHYRIPAGLNPGLIAIGSILAGALLGLIVYIIVRFFIKK